MISVLNLHGVISLKEKCRPADQTGLRSCQTNIIVQINVSSTNHHNEKMPVQLHHPIARGNGRAVAQYPAGLVPLLSTPSIGTHAQQLGSNELGDTFQKVQTDQKAGSVLLDAGEQGDMGVLRLEYMVQLFHLPGVYGPRRTYNEPRD